MSQEIRILKSYSKVWKIERYFYQIGGVNLPNPVALNTIIYFLIFAVVMYATRNFPLIGLIPGLYKFLLIPLGLAWLCNNKLLDGKNPLAFAISILKHYTVLFVFGSKINRYKFIDSKGKGSYVTKICYRILETI